MTSVVSIILHYYIVNDQGHVDGRHFSVGVADEESSALHDCPKHAVDSILWDILWLHLDFLLRFIFKLPPNLQ